MTLSMEKKCPTSITTKSGTFTFYEQKVLKCQAEQICRSKGQLLAPITNMEDRKAIQKLADQNCGIFREQIQAYHIGLENKVCGNEVTRVFSNGVKYNKTLHDEMYFILPRKGINCLATLWPPDQGVKGAIVVVGNFDNCKENPRRFICFDPIKANNNSTVTEEAPKLKRSERSEALSREISLTDLQSLHSLSQVFAFCILATICCFMFVLNRKLKNRNNLLDIKNESLTSDVESLTKECKSLKMMLFQHESMKINN